MYIIIIKVTHAIIIVNGRYSFSCRLDDDVSEVFVSEKYVLKVAIASGMISSMAIDKKRLPENVMATDMIGPSLKHVRPEMNLPKITTSMKKAAIKISFITKVLSMFYIIFPVYQ